MTFVIRSGNLPDWCRKSYWTLFFDSHVKGIFNHKKFGWPYMLDLWSGALRGIGFEYRIVGAYFLLALHLFPRFSMVLFFHFRYIAFEIFLKFSFRSEELKLLLMWVGYFTAYSILFKSLTLRSKGWWCRHPTCEILPQEVLHLNKR